MNIFLRLASHYEERPYGYIKVISILCELNIVIKLLVY